MEVTWLMRGTESHHYPFLYAAVHSPGAWRDTGIEVLSAEGGIASWLYLRLGPQDQAGAQDYHILHCPLCLGLLGTE